MSIRASGINGAGWTWRWKRELPTPALPSNRPCIVRVLSYEIDSLRGRGALRADPFGRPGIVTVDGSIRSVGRQLSRPLYMFSVYGRQLHHKLQRAHLRRHTGSVGLHGAARGTDHVPSAICLGVGKWILRQISRPNTGGIARRVRRHPIDTVDHGHLPNTGLD